MDSYAAVAPENSAATASDDGPVGPGSKAAGPGPAPDASSPEDRSTMPALTVAIMSVLMTVIGQFLLKNGVRQVGAVEVGKLWSMIPTLVLNPFIFFGFAVYGFSALLWLSAISRLDLSYAYPLISFGIVLVSLISRVVFHEAQPPNRLAGSAVIIIGLLIMR